jgi:Flp pilus assembly protein TadD
MKRTLVLLSVSFALGLPAVADPGERYLTAYFLIQEAERSAQNSEWSAAHAKYSAARKILVQIKADEPEWHANVVAFRLKDCDEQLAVLTPRLPAGAAEPVPPPPGAVGLPAPPSEAEQIRQLQDELQKARAEAQSLRELRDRLAEELQTKLGDPAPTDRATAKQLIESLRGLQAANEATRAKLAEAEAKAARADALSAELEQSREQVRTLAADREALQAQLQTALGPAGGGAQVEELLKKNNELTTQLASAQAEITKLRDQILAAPAVDTGAELVNLRADLTIARSDLDQAKILLAQRTEELQLTRAELEQVKAENIRLAASQDEILARLAESDRQLRAAKVSGEKNDQIIQQLRKENELLKQIAERKGASPTEPVAKTPPASGGGFLWFKPRRATPVATNAAATATAQSEDARLTATVKAPAPPESARVAAEEVKVAAVAATEAGEGSTEVRMLVGQARAALATRDFAGAKAKLTMALDREPENPAVLMNLGIALYQLNQLDEAGESLRKLVALAPNQGQARALLGIVHFRRGRMEDAYNELTRAVAIEPRNPEAHNYLGIVMSEKGWATAAEQEVRRALELSPNYADAHFNLAVIYSRQKTPRLELARYHYQKAVDLGATRDPQLEAVLKVSENK